MLLTDQNILQNAWDEPLPQYLNELSTRIWSAELSLVHMGDYLMNNLMNSICNDAIMNTFLNSI